jgi:GT2 family glycosyltransferase
LKIAVVILNWNGRKFLEEFLPQVIKFSKNQAEVIIADNASSDGSIEFLNQSFPGIRVIQFNKNYGFAGGYNRALQQVEADYYVLLNSDIQVTENWIPPVIELMEKDPLIAACQPKILSYHEPEMFEYAGAAGGFIDKYGYPFCRGRVFQNLERDLGQYNDTREVFWATGACMFIRAKVFHEVGGLDDHFFAHMEEIDFCWRLKNNGYKILFCPSSKIYHIGGGTLPKNNARKTYLNIRNNIIMLYKNLERKRMLKVFAARIFLDWVAAMKFLVDGGFKDMWAVARAHLHILRNLGKLRKKREKIHHQRVSEIFWGNIVVEHYLKRKTLFTELDPSKFTKDPS